MKSPKVEKNADAEAIFWDVRVSYDLQGGYPQTVFSHYLRIKVFTERGRDQESTISIPYYGRNHVSDIAGHTIKPDGTVLDLKKDAIFDKDVVKAGGFKMKSKSFAMPGVEPGSIIEYRWREVHSEQIVNYLRCYLQREIPVQVVTYHIRPLSHPMFPFGMRTVSFQTKDLQFQKERDGFYSATLANVPAFKEEPRMPPEDQVRAWMLVYYSEDKKLAPDKYWHETGRAAYEALKPQLKVSKDVKQIAAEIITDASTPEQKLERLFQYCRTQIKNKYGEETTAEERQDAKFNRSPADTLKQGVGTGHDINLAFAALATAAGFDARYAKLADRGDTFFNKQFPDDYFLRTYNIAVKVGDQWRFFDPGSGHLPYGMLRWQEEGIDALITDPKEPVFVRTPMTPAEKSQRKRVAILTLSEDGTLEGNVKVTYTGHEAISRRASQLRESEAERENNLIESIKNRLSTAEVTKVSIDDLDKVDKPLSYRYHIRVPGYAQRTGKRLFLQVGFFERNIGAMFPNASRRYDVYFQHPWSEDDSVAIKMPDGYKLDNADAPQPLNFGEVGGYNVKLSVNDVNQLIYSRTLTFGKNGRVLFPVEVYSQLKTAFDRVHEEDAHTVTLKQEPATRSANAQ